MLKPFLARVNLFGKNFGGEGYCELVKHLLSVTDSKMNAKKKTNSKETSLFGDNSFGAQLAEVTQMAINHVISKPVPIMYGFDFINDTTMKDRPNCLRLVRNLHKVGSPTQTRLLLAGITDYIASNMVEMELTGGREKRLSSKIMYTPNVLLNELGRQWSSAIVRVTADPKATIDTQRSMVRILERYLPRFEEHNLHHELELSLKMAKVLLSRQENKTTPPKKRSASPQPSCSKVTENDCVPIKFKKTKPLGWDLPPCPQPISDVSYPREDLKKDHKHDDPKMDFGIKVERENNIPVLKRSAVSEPSCSERTDESYRPVKFKKSTPQTQEWRQASRADRDDRDEDSSEDCKRYNPKLECNFIRPSPTRPVARLLKLDDCNGIELSTSSESDESYQTCSDDGGSLESDLSLSSLPELEARKSMDGSELEPRKSMNGIGLEPHRPVVSRTCAVSPKSGPFSGIPLKSKHVQFDTNNNNNNSERKPTEARAKPKIIEITPMLASRCVLQDIKNKVTELSPVKRPVSVSSTSSEDGCIVISPVTPDGKPNAYSVLMSSRARLSLKKKKINH